MEIASVIIFSGYGPDHKLEIQIQDLRTKLMISS